MGMSCCCCSIRYLRLNHDYFWACNVSWSRGIGDIPWFPSHKLLEPSDALVLQPAALVSESHSILLKALRNTERTRATLSPFGVMMATRCTLGSAIVRLESLLMLWVEDGSWKYNHGRYQEDNRMATLCTFEGVPTERAGCLC
jgi:hypothetical protein